MIHRQRESVRLTHIPTGTTAACYPPCFGRRAERFKLATASARQLLLARLCRPDEPSRPTRTYDLCPPFGIPPRIREGDRVICSGKEEVRAFLDGVWS